MTSTILLSTYLDNILVVKMMRQPDLPDFAVRQLPEYAPLFEIMHGGFKLSHHLLLCYQMFSLLEFYFQNKFHINWTTYMRKLMFAAICSKYTVNMQQICCISTFWNFYSIKCFFYLNSTSSPNFIKIEPNLGKK